MNLPHSNRKFSYADYLNWPEDENVEIIDGIPYLMTPAPSTKHQQVSMNLSYIFTNYFRSKGCRVFAAPFDVRLFSAGKKDSEIHDVVQPDLSVICDQNKLDEKCCNGSPDLIVEILSPSTAKMDKILKRNLYEEAGVKEYWIVDIQNELVEVYFLGQDQQYGKPIYYANNDQLESFLFEKLKIEVSDLFS